MKRYRLFFALWPSPWVRKAIVQTASPLLDEMHGRPIQAENLHITLHFIGSVTQHKKDCLQQAAKAVIAQPFNLSLDCFGTFRKARIFWMSAQKLPAELSLLHDHLEEALSACDFHGDERPYSPHLSLLRKGDEAGDGFPDFSINWPVDEFVLLESVTDSDGIHYKVIEKYPLQVSNDF